MNIVQYLLGKLAEECTEVAKEALKAQQFGLDEIYEGKSNKNRINEELNDVIAIIDMLKIFNCILDDSDNVHISEKKKKVLKFLEYSVSLNTVNMKDEELIKLYETILYNN